MINLVNLDQNTVVAALSPSQRRQVSLEENWLERVDWFLGSGRPQLQSQVLEAWQALALACIRSEKINQRAAGSPRIYSKLSPAMPVSQRPTYLVSRPEVSVHGVVAFHRRLRNFRWARAITPSRRGAVDDGGWA